MQDQPLIDKLFQVFPEKLAVLYSWGYIALVLSGLVSAFAMESFCRVCYAGRLLALRILNSIRFAFRFQSLPSVACTLLGPLYPASIWQ